MSCKPSSAGYITKRNHEADDEPDLSEREEDLLSALEDDFELGGMREKRMQELRQEFVH